MQLIMNDARTGHIIIKLREAVTLCMYASKDGRIVDDEGETMATVDRFGVIRDLDGKRVDL